MILFTKRITKALIRLRGCACWSAFVLFANPRRQVISRCGPYNNLSETDSADDETSNNLYDNDCEVTSFVNVPTENHELVPDSVVGLEPDQDQRPGMDATCIFCPLHLLVVTMRDVAYWTVWI